MSERTGRSGRDNHEDHNHINHEDTIMNGGMRVDGTYGRVEQRWVSAGHTRQYEPMTGQPPANKIDQIRTKHI